MKRATKAGSSQASYIPGIESSSVDPHILRPTSGFRGNRGMVMRGEEGYGRAYDKYGRLYRSMSYQNVPSGRTDQHIILGRSGASGLRGAVDPFEHAPLGASEDLPKADFAVDEGYATGYGSDSPADVAPPRRGWLEENWGVVALGVGAGLFFWFGRR
jgi:hypothetical protein